MVKKIEAISDLTNYLNARLNVDNNPHDNFYLYKDWLKREKHIDIMHSDFGRVNYLAAYIKHMKSIGWNDPVKPLKSIPKDKLEEMIKRVIDNASHVEDILCSIAHFEGRSGLVHRSIRDWPSFISDVIFGNDDDPIHVKYKNFRAERDDQEAVLRWAAIYYIEMVEEPED